MGGRIVGPCFECASVDGCYPGVGVRARKNERARSDFGQGAVSRSGRARKRKRIRGDVESGGLAGVDGEVAIRAYSRAGVLQRPTVEDEVGGGIGGLPQIAWDAAVANLSNTQNTAADRGRARVSIDRH